MRILNECSFIKPEGIAKIEELRNAKYVFESCLKDKSGNWANFPVAVFYTETPHPQGSNYFGIFIEDEQIMITNAITATEEFGALQIGNDIIYSRYRHDYRRHPNSGVAIDGGRDYIRISGDINQSKTVKLKVVGDHLEIVE